MKRFGVSLEDNLLKELDSLARKQRLPNRSQAIRYLIRSHTVTEKWDTNRTVSGCVVLVYDHHKRDLLNRSIDIQHKYQHLVLSTQHVHLDHNNCLETITLKGKAIELRELADKLIALKGMKHGKFVMSTIG
ncbi:MAG: nickel-responsive transcriptional regulator NikR [Candidatus Omnitrophica bacterium]|nr:nickel-responsive transcriptional regulator NikR [Candidatus Omnitrophota bacterium]